MENMLLEWAQAAKSTLEDMGYSVCINIPSASLRGVHVDLDSDEFAGRICHWQPDIFEFQFHSMLTGNVILLETVNLSNTDALNAFVIKLLTERLPALDPNSNFTVGE